MGSAPSRILAAPDKFRGTASAAEVAAAVARAALSVGVSCDQAPVADGGEGTLDALGGAVHVRRVKGPLGAPVEAEWRMRDSTTAVVEMARASGLTLAGGPELNDPIQATTYGTGELVASAIDQGARRVIVGLGGSATTDGGLAAVQALGAGRRLRGVELIVACDVTTEFLDAADVFGPQKGATPAQVALLRRRLERVAQLYERDHGVDVRHLPGSGAAGGLAGGLAAVGGRLVPGFEVIAEAIDLSERIERADLVVTGEGFLDRLSFAGKAVGGVIERADAAGVPVLVVAGDVEPGIEVAGAVELVSLVERFGERRAVSDVLACVEQAVLAVITSAG